MQYERLLRAARMRIADDPLAGACDLAIVRVLGDAGLRCEELAQLQRRHSCRCAGASGCAASTCAVAEVPEELRHPHALRICARCQPAITAAAALSASDAATRSAMPIFQRMLSSHERALERARSAREPAGQLAARELEIQRIQGALRRADELTDDVATALEAVS